MKEKQRYLNFIDNELKGTTTLVTIFFNPWMFPSETELFTAFYTELAKGLEKTLSHLKGENRTSHNKTILPHLLVYWIEGYFRRENGKLLSSVRLEELRDRIGKNLN